MSSGLISKNMKTKAYKTIIFQVVLYGGETWSLIVMEECKVRLFENSILRRIMDQGGENGSGEGFTMRIFIVSTVHVLYTGPLNL